MDIVVVAVEVEQELELVGRPVVVVAAAVEALHIAFAFVAVSFEDPVGSLCIEVVVVAAASLDRPSLAGLMVAVAVVALAPFVRVDQTVEDFVAFVLLAVGIVVVVDSSSSFELVVVDIVEHTFEPVVEAAFEPFAVACLAVVEAFVDEVAVAVVVEEEVEQRLAPFVVV